MPGISPHSTFHRYAFDGRVTLLLRACGVRPARDGVRVNESHLIASFGPLNAVIERANISTASATGPYRLAKVVGPRLSAADHGITFGTTADAGVCLEFNEPIEPVFGPWKHPGLTLTVEDPDALIHALVGAP